jgi:hypothetical protein
MDRRKASSVVSTDLNMRRFERQMLRVAAMIVVAALLLESWFQDSNVF